MADKLSLKSQPDPEESSKCGSSTCSNHDWAVDDKGGAKPRKGQLSKKTVRENRSSDGAPENKSSALSSSEPQEGEVSDFRGGSLVQADGDPVEEFDGGLNEKFVGKEEDQARLAHTTMTGGKEELLNRIRKGEGPRPKNTLRIKKQG
ncbi:hypothetical protein V5799_001091 [Amblyomma americanum]|uniref:Uncharacterized protein n=1 Tax=Amblyomma americanum TaxID=6943 RepID=A0AAQ4D168_AMBAM